MQPELNIMHGFFLKIFLTIAGLSLLMDWYVFNGLRTFTTDWRPVRRRQMVTWGYLVIAVGITVTLLLDAGTFSTARGMTPLHEWVLSLFLTFFFTKIFFIIVLFLGDTGRFFYGIANHFLKPKNKSHGPFFPARRKFISEMAILVAAVPFTGFFY
ncbi:MAG: MFS transporter, partial [Sphingobacteriales bacterium]